jgi:hypothetical protein
LSGQVAPAERLRVEEVVASIEDLLGSETPFVGVCALGIAAARVIALSTRAEGGGLAIADGRAREFAQGVITMVEGDMSAAATTAPPPSPPAESRDVRLGVEPGSATTGHRKTNSQLLADEIEAAFARFLASERFKSIPNRRARSLAIAALSHDVLPQLIVGCAREPIPGSVGERWGVEATATQRAEDAAAAIVARVLELLGKAATHAEVGHG